jgi:transcriptional regulator with XRE-family HTH domain
VAQPGRPLKSLDPDASHAARLGYEIRSRRIARDLTLEAFGNEIGFSPQQVSAVELATAQPSPRFVAACERALEAEGALERLLPAIYHEQAMLRHARSAARADASSALRFAGPHQDVGEVQDVDPTTRRGLLDAGAIAALGGLGVAGSTAAPAAAREIDPELPEHSTNLLRLLGRHDEMFGPRDVLASVRHEISLIAEHRRAARGELRTALMRVESRWAELAAWLSEDSGRRRARDAWTDRALRLAQDAGYSDMVAFARGRRSEWASDAQRAVAYAEDALRVPGTSAQTRAWCSRQAAISHAMAGDAASCERHLADAYGLLDDDSPAPPWAGESRVDRTGTRAAEARCWLMMAPAKAVGLYEDALRNWPQAEARDGAVHQARLAIACAQTGEIDRAKAEGRRALAITKSTKSATATRELRRLRDVLAA